MVCGITGCFGNPANFIYRDSDTERVYSFDIRMIYKVFFKKERFN